MQPILRINLSNHETTLFDPPMDWRRKYLGGASLAARILYDELRSDVSPLDEQASLLFLTGPLTGTAGPAVGRSVVCARSPATGIWGEANMGGFWGVELRKAGYDGLWIQGKANHPVYIFIKNREVHIQPAARFRGMSTSETQSAIKDEIGSSQTRIACIGPAGEIGLPFALILCDHGRVAGRTGMGAVMGAKNLKAIAILGDGEIPLEDPQTFDRLRTQINRQLRADPVSVTARQLGTASIAEYFDYLGLMPKKYFHQRYLDEPLAISGSVMRDTILKGVSACHGCVIACGRVVQDEAGNKIKGPEYETCVGFGPNLLINDLNFVSRMGVLCDHYGVDTISMSHLIGLAFHLIEIGKINPHEFDLPKNPWGNLEAVERLVHETMRREGLGAYLAQGALSFANAFNASQEAIQVNGLEVPYHDPRGGTGMALVYATSPRGACHNQSCYYFVEIGQAESEIGIEYADRLGGAEKGANVARHQDWVTVLNSLVMCIFANVPPTKVVQLVNAATGFGLSLNEVMRIGERGWNLKRLINQRLGLSKENDTLPKALRTPLPKGEDTAVPDLEGMLNAYYQIRGWEACTGLPSEKKISALELF